MVELINDNLVQSVGWALLQFISQGTVVLALTWIILTALRAGSANVRYIVACLGLFAMFILPVSTTIRNMRSTPPSLVSGSVLESPQSAGETAAPPEASKRTSAATVFSRIELEDWLPTTVSLWLIGVAILSLRILSGWWLVQRMRRQGSAIQAELCAAVRSVAARLGLRRPVQIMESALVSVPTAIGSVRPLILWPVGALAGLSAAQLEAVIAHELAHIRRLDYFVNMLQTMVETLLFYHPAVWILSRRIRQERENCCDDIAVAVCQDPVVYVTALTSLEQLRSDRVALALRATGGSLTQRVYRLLGMPGSERRPIWSVVAIAAIVIALALNGNDTTLGSRVQPPAATASAVTPTATAPAVPASPIAALSARTAFVPPAQKIDTVRDHQISWSNPLVKSRIRFQGSFMLANDDRDFVSISPSGYFIFAETSLLGGERTIELRGRSDGTIERKYTSAGREVAYEPEGAAWLREILPMLVRRTGFAADQRVARILMQFGPVGVLSEINQLSTDYVRRVYFKEFLEQAKPAGSLLDQTLDQASRQISSDYELAELLITVGATVSPNAMDWDTYLNALSSVSSDYEHRRVLSMVSDNGLSEDALTRLIRSSSGIRSSYEHATLLIQIAQRHRLAGDLRDAYLSAANRISSTYERGRVLEALLRNETK